MAHDPKDVLAVVGWYWRDWRSSKARAVLSPLARGVYRELLDAHYAERDGCLPDDDTTLAALAGVTPKVWAKVRDEILPWLPVVAPGRRQNERAGIEWGKAMSYRAACKAGGRATAAKRWGSTSQPVATLQAEQPPAYRTPSPSPSPSPITESIPSPPAPVASPEPEATDALVLTIRAVPIKAWSKDARVTALWAQTQRDAHPGLDLAAEVKSAAAWWTSHPARTGKRSSVAQFLGSWFSRAEESPPTHRHQEPHLQPSPPEPAAVCIDCRQRAPLPNRALCEPCATPKRPRVSA